LALMCDIRIASESAQFGQPEVNKGLCLQWAATVRLPRFFPAFAAEMLLTGNPISAMMLYGLDWLVMWYLMKN